MNFETAFISDTHLGHGNIIKYCNRPFLMDVDKKALEANGGTWHDGTWKGSRSSSYQISREAVAWMDATIIDNINKYVPHNGVMYHLGDVCFAPKHLLRQKLEDYRNRINCQEIHLILGNHDGCEYRPWLKNECRCKLPNNDTCYGIYADYFTTVSDARFIYISGHKLALFHYAQAIWNKSHKNAIHFYAHSHSEAEPWLNKIMPGRRSTDVGVDHAYKLFGEYRPFAFQELLKITNNSGHRTGDHHINPNAPCEEDLKINH